MATREIPRKEWREFFDSFSRQHEGWLVNVEVIGEDLGDQVEVTDLPLQGVSADTKAHENDIVITLGNGPADEVSRIIENPVRVVFDDREDGGHASLAVDSPGGEQTIVRFRAAVQPENLDRIKEIPRARGAGIGSRRTETEE